MMDNYIGSNVAYFIVGIGKRYTYEQNVSTFPVKIDGVSTQPVDTERESTLFTKEERAKNINALLNQFAIIMGTGVRYEVRKQTVTNEKVE